MEMTWEWWFSLSLGEKRKKKHVPKNGCLREGVHGVLLKFKQSRSLSIANIFLGF